MPAWQAKVDPAASEHQPPNSKYLQYSKYDAKSTEQNFFKSFMYSRKRNNKDKGERNQKNGYFVYLLI